MEFSDNIYGRQIEILKQKDNEVKIAYEVYVSRRKIWISTPLCLISFVAPYIYTRRWQPLGIAIGGLFLIGCVISDSKDSVAANFQKGQELTPICMILAAMDNGVAINKHRKKVQEKSSEPPLDQIN